MDTFNSLYGILEKLQNTKNLITDFQFPLWDTYNMAEETNLLGSLTFQFPLWDTKITITIDYEGNKPIFQFPLWDTKFIFYSLFFNSFYFQFPLWDT